MPVTRSIALRDAEVRELIDAGDVTVRREIKPRPKQCILGPQIEPPGESYEWPNGKPISAKSWKLWDGCNVGDYGGGPWEGDIVWAAICPIGEPGETLWVKEAWACESSHIVAYRVGGECGAWMGDGAGGRLWIHHGYVLEAPGYPFGLDRLCTFGIGKYGGKWRSARSMPRWASRLTVTIAAVRVEHVEGEWVWVVELKRGDA